MELSVLKDEDLGGGFFERWQSSAFKMVAQRHRATQRLVTK
ncbi:hypothetical protein [Flagellimonas sp. 389]|nr:hypothetical protein [Flagellimonas sp. 389]